MKIPDWFLGWLFACAFSSISFGAEGVLIATGGFVFGYVSALKKVKK